MKCVPECFIGNECHYCYNGECYAEHWYECSKGVRKDKDKMKWKNCRRIKNENTDREIQW